MVSEYNKVPTNYVTGISINGSSIILPPDIFGTEIIQPGTYICILQVRSSYISLERMNYN